MLNLPFLGQGGTDLDFSNVLEIQEHRKLNQRTQQRPSFASVGL